jgi:hypothetical protein
VAGRPDAPVPPPIRGRRARASRREPPGRRRAPGGVFTIFVSAQGNQLRGGINGAALVEAEDDALTHGQLGLYADRAEAAFHRLDVNSGGK